MPSTPWQEEENMESGVFKWTLQDDPFKDQRLADVKTLKMVSAQHVVINFGVPRPQIQKYIEEELEETANFVSLPSTLFFVICYAIVVIIHDDAVVIRAVENSAEFDIIDNSNWAYDNEDMAFKDIYSVNSITDWYSWVRIGFLPLLLPQRTTVAQGRDPSDPQVDQYLRNYTAKERGTYLVYDRIMGGIRFSQERIEAKPSKCQGGSNIRAFYDPACYGDYYKLEPEEGLAFAPIRNAKNVTWFYTHEEAELHMERINNMEAQDWISDSTTRVEISIPMYTAEFGLHTIVSVGFYFARSGHIWKEIVPLSCYGEWYKVWYYVVYDITWALCLVSLFKTELLEVLGYFKRSKFPVALHELRTEYLNFWNFIDWVSIVGGLVIVLLALTSWGGTDRVNLAAVGMPDINPNKYITNEVMQPDGNYTNRTTLITDPRYEEQVSMYIDALRDTVVYIHRLRLVLSAYPLVIVVRLFKAFKAQPRLALVTKTLAVTGIDLLHFMLVFCSIFCTLCISGFVLFGRRVEMFETFPRSINSVFRLMLGDFDWDALRVTGYLDGFVWLALTLTLLNLLLLNMVLAIVMDGYSEVKKRSISGDTLFAEIQEILAMAWNVSQGVWVPLEGIAEALKDLQERNDAAYAEAMKVNEMKSLKKEMQRTRSGLKKAAEKEGEHEEKAVFLLGRDTKAVVGMRVWPVDEGITVFVGPGKIHIVGHGMTKARVLHEDGNVRDYDIGHDLNFELKLADGVDPVPFEEGEGHTLGLQVMSPERLMKIVTSYNKRHKMNMPQAVLLLEKAVRQYYKEHCEDVDWTILRQMVTKIDFRAEKIKSLLKQMKHKVEFMTSTDEMAVLGHYMSDFYVAVHDDRQRTLSDILAVEADVSSLRKNLLIAEEQALTAKRSNKIESEVSNALALTDAEEERAPVRVPPNSKADQLLHSTVVDMDSMIERSSVTSYAAVEQMTHSSSSSADLLDVQLQLYGNGREDPIFHEENLAKFDAELGVSDAVGLAMRLLQEKRAAGEVMDPVEGWARESSLDSDSDLGSIPSFDDGSSGYGDNPNDSSAGGDPVWRQSYLENGADPGDDDDPAPMVPVAAQPT